MDTDQVRTYGTIRKYLEESLKTFTELRWIWLEMISPKGRQTLKSFALFTLLTTMLSYGSPIAIQFVIDGLLASNNSKTIFGLAAFAALAIATKIVQYFQIRAQELSWCEAYESIEAGTNKLFFEKSLGQHMREGKALSVSNVQNGREKIQIIFDNLLWQGIGQVIRFTVTVVFLSIISPICVLFLGFGIAIQLMWSLYLNWQSAEIFGPIESEYRKNGRHKTERWKNIERVKTNGKSDAETEILASWTKRTVAADRFYSVKMIKHFTARDLVLFACSFGAMSYASLRVINGDWTIGMFWPILTWMNAATDQLAGIMQVERLITKHLPAIKTIHQALSLAPDVQDIPNAVHLNGELITLEVKGLSYRYRTELLEKDLAPETSQQSVLKNINLKLMPGERLGIIGQSGIGKTTLGRLILRYEDPEEGVILVNGINLKDIRTNDWHRVTGLIAQRDQVFDGSVRDNLLYGLKLEDQAKMTDAELWTIARKLKVDFGERLTKGLDTVVGMSGIKLSGGQAQRLLIASAIIRKPRLIIIDEATSSLDSSTEQEVQRGIMELLPKETSALIIAHRLSTLQTLCNRFIVMTNGADKTTPGQGGQIETVADKFEDLWTSSPTFKKLAKDQGLTAP